MLYQSEAWIYIYDNIWLAANNDVLVMSGLIHLQFSQVKIIGESPRKWPKVNIHSKPYVILLWPYMILRMFKYREINENFHQSITVPLLFMMSQWVVVLQCHANTFCDITFWSIVLRMFLSWPCTFSYHRQVDYHLLVIKLESQHFH